MEQAPSIKRGEGPPAYKGRLVGDKAPFFSEMGVLAVDLRSNPQPQRV